MTWLDDVQERLKDDPEFAIERLVLEFPTEIRCRMRELGLTQRALAKRLGVSESSVSKLLNYNQNLTIKSLALIANALDAEWELPRLVARQPLKAKEGEV